jgi:hypothetical protein
LLACWRCSMRLSLPKVSPIGRRLMFFTDSLGDA